MAGPALPTSITAGVTTGEIADTVKAYTMLNRFDNSAGTTGQLLRWNGSLWISTDPITALPAGSTLTVIKSGTWPARPTSRADIVVIWKGADPSPSIVSSGTGGMLDNVDIRAVTP
jgi:hypothetical protein